MKPLERPIGTTATFSAGVLHGLLVTVTPDGWRVRRRGQLLASGSERGALGVARAIEAVDSMKGLC